MRFLLRWISIIGLFLLAINKPALGDKNREGSEALLPRALKEQGIRDTGAAPFLLNATIQVKYGRQTFPGTYKLIWFTPSKWREELAFSGYRRSRFGVVGGYEQVRSQDFEPWPIMEFSRAIDFAKLLHVRGGEELGKVRKQKINGNDDACVEVKGKKVYFDRELCFDISTGYLVRAEILNNTNAPDAEWEKAEYSNFKTWAGRAYPSKVLLQLKHEFTIDFSTVSFEKPSETDATLLKIPAGAEFWGDCDDVVMTDLARKVVPQYPLSARSARIGGTVTVYARIEPNGSVSHVHVLESASPDLNQATEEAIRQWKFRPATCGGKPVTTETVIDTIYSMRQ